MIHRFEVVVAPGLPDPKGAGLAGRMARFSPVAPERVRTAEVYALDEAALGGAGLPASLRKIGEELYADPVLHALHLDGEAVAAAGADWYVEVAFRPGVTDNVGRTAQESLEYRLGRPLAAGHHLHFAQGYFLWGALSRAQVEALAAEWLANDLIQQVVVLERDDWPARRDELFRLPVVTLSGAVGVARIPLTEAEEVAAVSRERLLALSDPEIAAVRAHYAEPGRENARAAVGLGAEATDVELEVIAQTWSEHCKHKIFNASIDYREEGGEREVVRSLYKTYVQGATRAVRELHGADDWCLSVFTDNAGVVRFDDDWSFVFKVETHNSPSALDPYGGALTGIVGVNRDPFGTGRGAELLFNTDVFCFAPPHRDAPLPPRLLHPRRIYDGVRRGVEHGGNKSGVPTVNGSVTFHDGFLGKPLVFCGTGGLLPARLHGRPGHEKWIAPGDRIVMVGGRIGKDGIHGATFSSQELSETSPATAVQIGDPIVQKKMFDFLLAARDAGLFTAITDNGAGGLSSSVGEMARMSGGAELHLDRAPLKYPGLQPWEIMISEAQERMTLAVPPKHEAALLALSRRMDVESTVLGTFTDSGYFHASYEGETVAWLDMEFLHEGVPTMELTARWRPPERPALTAAPPADLTGALLTLLGRLNICGKESMIRQYDHEVQGASVVKPLVGAANDGPSDAAVLRPLLGSMRGLAVAHGICPRYGEIDTAAMAGCAFDEAVRSIVAVGGDPERIAALDNFCWSDPVPGPGNPTEEAEYKAAQLVRAARALHDAAVAFRVPLISGKDSMKNDYAHGEQRISIPPTLLVSAVGIVADVRKAVTMDAKAAGDRVYLVGATREELGASEYHAAIGEPGGEVPRAEPELAREWYRALAAAISQGFVSAAHDCSDGGLAVALAEMAFAGGLGMELDLAPLAKAEGLAPHALLFSESPSRLVVTVQPGQEEAFQAAMAGTPCHVLGSVTEAPRLVIGPAGGEAWVSAAIADLKEAWQAPLRDF